MEWLFTTRNGKIVMLISSLTIFIFFLSIFKNFFALIVVSVALTMIMLPFVNYFENFGLKREISILFSFIIVVGVVAGIIGVSYPVLVKQFSQMQSSFGIKKYEIGDTVCVQDKMKDFYFGKIKKQDSILTIQNFSNFDSIKISDIVFINKVNDSILVNNHETVLLSNLNYRLDNEIRILKNEDKVETRKNLFQSKIFSIEKKLKQKFYFLNSIDIITSVNSFISQIFENVDKFLQSFATLLGGLVGVPLITFMFIKEYRNFIKFIIRSVPNKYFEMSLSLFNTLESQLGNYIRGVCVEFFFVSLITFLGYLLIGLDFPLTNGIVFGFLNIIPLLGGYLGIIPTMFFSISQSGDFSFFFPIILVNIFVQTTNYYILKPTIYKNAHNVHPILILLLILFGFEIIGILGAIIIVPIFTLFVVIAKELNWGLSKYKITNV